MIYIGKPFIEKDNDRVRLVAHVKNEGENKEIDLYYSVEPEFAQYLCHEQADAFVLPMLLRAAVSHQSIEIDAPLSEKLYHNLKHGVLYAMYKMDVAQNPQENASSTCPSISCKGTSNRNYGGTAVGTGCSLGVDSFSVIKKYLFDNKDIPSYKITHFTCFNVGAFGWYDTEGRRASFQNEVKELKNFSKKFGIPLLSVDTNMLEMFPERNFNWSHSYLNMGCVLALQKLWGKYLYASGYSVDNLRFNLLDSALYEPYLLPHLSTESTELVSADLEKSRSEKIRFIMDDPIVKQNINVCLKSQSVNDGKMEDKSEGHRNCGHCEKCLRTMLQLDIFGRLEEYSDAFNLDGWKERKDEFLVKVLTKMKSNPMYADIYSTITDENYIPTSVRRKAQPNHSITKKIKNCLIKIKHLFG